MWSTLVHRVTGIDRDDAGAASLAAACFFCVLGSYYTLRPMREEMGLAGGVDNLPWLFLATLGVMLLATPLFGWMASRTPRRRLVAVTYRFFLVNLALFYVALRAAPPAWEIVLGRVFYVWISVFNLFIVSVFWALLADVFTLDRSKRAFGAIAAGGTIGAIVGAAVTANLVDVIGRASLILISIALLEIAAQIARRIALRAPASAEAPASSASGASSRSRLSDALEGITDTLRSPYLLAVTVYLFAFTFTSTVLYFEQGHIVDAAFGENRDGKVAFFARIDLWVNVMTLVLQLGLASRIIAKFGVAMTLALLPLITMIGFGALAVTPALATLFVVQVARRAMNYGLAKPARETLFTVIPPDEKYKAKTFIDTFVYRGGDAIGAGIFQAMSAAGLALTTIALLLTPLSLVWLLIAGLLGRMQNRRAQQEAHPPEPIHSYTTDRNPMANQPTG